MINPDFNIKNDPGKISPDLPVGDKRPIGVPQTKKQFKVMMGKESLEDEDEEGEEEGKKVKEPKLEVKDKGKTLKTEVDKDAKVSIFALAETPNKTKEVEVEDVDVDEEVAPQEQKPAKPQTAFHPLLKGKETAKEAKVEAPNLHAIAGEKKVTLSDVDAPAKGKKSAWKGESARPELIPATYDKDDLTNLSDHRKDDEEQVSINLDMVKPQQPQHFVVGEKVPIKPSIGVSDTKTQERYSLPETAQAYHTPEVTKERPVNTKFTQEQPDIAYLNPMHMGLQATTNAATGTQIARPQLPADVMKLIDQMVEKITTLSNEGKTDTTITIKNPPMFDGANLKLTSFDSARGEFNISFENLKPEALRVLQQNMDGLKMAMNERGFTVHILTATTVIESPIYTAEAQTGGGRREGEKGEEQSGKDQEEEKYQG